MGKMIDFLLGAEKPIYSHVRSKPYKVGDTLQVDLAHCSPQLRERIANEYHSATFRLPELGRGQGRITVLTLTGKKDIESFSSALTEYQSPTTRRDPAHELGNGYWRGLAEPKKVYDSVIGRPVIENGGKKVFVTLNIAGRQHWYEDMLNTQFEQWEEMGKETAPRGDDKDLPLVQLGPEHERRDERTLVKIKLTGDDAQKFTKEYLAHTLDKAWVMAGGK